MAALKPFEFTHAATRNGLLEVLGDLAAPYFEPTVFAGFGTPFQNYALQGAANATGDVAGMLELEDRTSEALRRWVDAAGVGVVGELLLDIISTPPPPSFCHDLYQRRRSSWDFALCRVAFAIEALDPSAYIELRERNYKLRTLLDSD